MLRRRPVAKVAAVGAVAHHAGKAGANAAAADADQTAQAELPAAEQQAAPAEAAPSADDNMEELTKLKGLLDSGVLTQAEFDAQKQKILQTM
jgi:membrane protease subunit (stomatin/prohibitin family)